MIVSILFSSFGCYSTVFIGDQDKMRAVLNDQEEVVIVQDDSSEYYLEESFYNFIDDSIYGRAQRIDYVKQAIHSYSKKLEPVQIKVSIYDVAQIQLEEFDESKTIILALTTISLISVLVLLGISESVSGLHY